MAECQAIGIRRAIEPTGSAPAVRTGRTGRVCIVAAMVTARDPASDPDIAGQTEPAVRTGHPTGHVGRIRDVTRLVMVVHARDAARRTANVPPGASGRASNVSMKQIDPDGSV